MLPPLSTMPFKFRMRAVLILIVVVMITQVYFFHGTSNDSRMEHRVKEAQPEITKRINVKQQRGFRDVATVKSPHLVVTGWDLPALNYSQKLKIIETIKTNDMDSIEGNEVKNELNEIVKGIDEKVKVRMHVKDYDEKESKVMEDSNQKSINKEGNFETQEKPKYELRHQKNLPVVDYVPSIAPVTTVNCAAIANKDAQETAKAEEYMKSHPKIPVPNEQFVSMTKDCSKFKKDRGYILSPLSETEKNFPLAFSIAVYKDLEQMERLLRAIYMPQNYYCIHVDKKASPVIHNSVQSIANCFDNVFIASHLDDIIWGGYSVLLPAINCMKDFVKYYRRRWLYFINLTAQEFPLKTNYELVRILQALNGNNEVFGSVKNREPWRTDWVWDIHYNATLKDVVFQRLPKLHSPPPFNITIHKGSLHGAFTRNFVHFMMETDVGQQFSEWCKDTARASEHYWNSLNFNKHIAVPGGFNGPDEEKEYHYWHSVIRAKHWKGYLDRVCSGKFVRGICVFGVGDLPWLTTVNKLFANKFLLDYEYLSFDCLEEFQRNRTKFTHRQPFDDSYYRSLPTSKYGRGNGLV